jgi:hypothetical protein
MVNGPLHSGAERGTRHGRLRQFARHYWACADASIFMKIRGVFAANTGKIANRAFKPVC